jgi:hypothetical protein
MERPLPRTVPNSNSAPGPGLVWSRQADASRASSRLSTREIGSAFLPGSSREHDDHCT